MCTSEATKGVLAVGRQGRLPHDPLSIAHCSAVRGTLLLFASIRLIDEQSMAQQPVLCPFDLLQRGMRRHTLCNLVNLRISDGAGVYLSDACREQHSVDMFIDNGEAARGSLRGL